jgi:hypothetical protein
MDSTRPIPFQAAVAYGMKPTQANRTSNNSISGNSSGRTPTGQPVTSSPGAVIRPPASRNGNAPRATPALANLVSGKVDSAVSRGQGFDAPRGAPMPNSSGALQMYSRAADRVEVATNATLGRLLDTRA